MNRDRDLFAIPVELHGQMGALRDWRREDLDRYACCQQPRQRWKDFDSSFHPRARGRETRAFMASPYLALVAGPWPVTRSSSVAIADRESGELREVVSWYRVSLEIGWSSIGFGIVDLATWDEVTGSEARGLWICHLLAAMPTNVRLGPGIWPGKSGRSGKSCNLGTMRRGEEIGFVEQARFRQAVIADGRPCDDLEGWMVGSGWKTWYPDGFAPFCS